MFRIFVGRSVQLILVGGFNPFEKYARQIGSFPQGFGVKIKKMKPPPSILIDR